MSHVLRCRLAIALSVATAAACLAGCAGADRSNPTLTITSAEIQSDRADVGVRIENPGDAHLRLERMTYTLTYGPLPVTDGVWRGPRDIASGESFDLDLSIPFETPPLDPDASVVELSGTMMLTDTSNRGDMRMTESAFQSSTPVGR